MGQPQHTVTRHLGGRVVIASGDVRYEAPLHVTEPLGEGLRIVVVLDGRMTLQAGSVPPVHVCGPTSLAVYSEGVSPRDQTFQDDEPFRSVLVHTDRDLVRSEFGVDPAVLLRPGQGARVAIRAGRVDPACRAVAAQILACPTGRSAGLYRLSKALELTALVLATADIQRDTRRPVRLSASEADRIRAGRDILLAEARNPPDLGNLALRCGINAWKLNRGFRALYGMTPYAFLQEHRLRLAYRLLASGQMSVGQAALAVGYSQPHFATLFRKRFGVPPSALLARGDDPLPPIELELQ
ncbi:helix-turn-helix transcriptional regulator [Marinivivus vitaminiproducens]|uniref:helix-turn-helix transcriptional regulator n=1 Tax=Marinivivus vitaminiproducens TaxID=3035935 RepID=UPI00279A092F|nr:AraC family transcriptional regulator [Geminicoccaceae bacterium SCSIO 64248]